MKERPITCTPVEIRGLLDGSLTTILRPFKCVNPEWEFVGFHLGWDGFIGVDTRNRREVRFIDGDIFYDRSTSLGIPGHRLWVREVWAHFDLWVSGPCGFGRIVYKADNGSTTKDKWMSPVVMPKKYSRITMEIIRIEAIKINGVWMEKYYVEVAK